MKKKSFKPYNPTLILLLLSFSINLVYAVSFPIERVYVQTDKQVYLAGESLWSKLYITRADGEVSTFSKIAYLELIGDSIPYVQQKIDIQDGTAASRLQLPVNLPTGHYRLVAYTRAMRNEGEQVFFNRIITIYNTFTNERIGSSQAELPNQIEGSSPLNLSGISTDKASYSIRQEGQIRLTGLQAEDYNLSVSVRQKDLLPEPLSTDMQHWKQHLPAKNIQSTALFIPEYEGHIVTGNIIATDSLPLGSDLSILTPLIAFPGKGISLFSGKLDDNGLVNYYTNRIDGTEDIMTSVLSASTRDFRVDIQSPFASHRTIPLPIPEISDTLKNELLARSIGVQAMQAYFGDSIWDVSTGLPQVISKPDRVYILDEYTRFTTMAEVITEFVLGLRFRTMNGKRHLSALTEEGQGFTTANTLVLLDGIPLLEHDAIYDYNPLLVERINIYYGKYVFGEQMFDGIAYFQTYENEYKGVRLDSSSQLYTYKGTESTSHFYTPDYSDAEKRASRLPDIRHTLLWIPDIRTEGKDKIEIPFSTSDLRGQFIVTAEGISKDGKVFRAETSFTVE